MVCNSLMRHLVGDDYRIDKIVGDSSLASQYKLVLKLILDNDSSQ